jgi:hypothetical protein
MQSAHEQFKISISRVRDLIGFYDSLNSQITNALDISDLLRAALVLLVSALDYYIHEVVILGMLEIYHNKRSEPSPPPNNNQSAFGRFKVSLSSARQERIDSLSISALLENEIQSSYDYDDFLDRRYTISELIPILSAGIEKKLNQSSWLENEIRENLSYKSFQEPDRIADAIRLISDAKLWDQVAIEMNKPAKEIKEELKQIVERRNKIAHEADIDPTLNIGERWPIDSFTVKNAVDFIENVVKNIHKIIL